MLKKNNNGILIVYYITEHQGCFKPAPRIMVFRFVTFVLLTTEVTLQTSADDMNPNNISLLLNPEDPEYSKNVKHTLSKYQQNRILNAETFRDAKEELQTDEKKNNNWDSHHWSVEESDKYSNSDATLGEFNEQVKHPPEDKRKECQDETDNNSEYDGIKLVEWIISNGGYIHPNVRIGADPSGKYRGVFVKNWNAERSSDGVGIGKSGRGIGKDEVIAEIPW